MGNKQITITSASRRNADEEIEKFKKTLILSRPKRSAQQKSSRPFDEHSIEYKLLERIIDETLEFNNGNARMQTLKSKVLLIKNIHENVIGSEAVFRTPFAENRFLPLTYCDYIASGKPLKFIEDYLFEEVLPTYANTHTTSSFSGFQTTHFREDARRIIAECVNARLKGEDSDVVLFQGSGSTSAISTLVHCIGIREMVQNAKCHEEIPVVFISPYEHHSNILPWREVGAVVVQIIEDKFGNVNFEFFEECLKKYKNGKRVLISSFSAGSNVTGVLTDCDRVSKLAHEFGALSFFDYAGAAPYVPIDMNPKEDPLYQKDAIFISPHKFIGGPGTPGVLVAKKKLFQNKTPNRPAGGTVYFVDASNHSYTNIIEEREEGGTPDIIGSIRCALAFKLKQDVGAELITKIEENYRERAFDFLKKNPNLHILGPGDVSIREGGVQRLAFFSFLVKHGDFYLHHSFISLLMNDLFGIQTRSGCACAGPYGEEILGISQEEVHELEGALIESYKSPISLVHLKPGWIRLNFNYFFDDKTVDFILNAMDFVASNGWKFLPYYIFNEKTNEWMHRNFDSNSTPIGSIHTNFSKFLTQHRKKLTDVTFQNGQLEFVDKFDQLFTSEPKKLHNYADILQNAQELLDQSVELVKNNNFTLDFEEEITKLFGDESTHGFRSKYGHLRWYLLPSEALADLYGKPRLDFKVTSLIKPKIYPTSEEYVSSLIEKGTVFFKQQCNSNSCKQ